MTEKYCTTCKILKPLSNFCVNKSGPDGHQTKCRACRYKYALLYKRTRKGLITAIYGSQLYSARKRKHPTPEYSLKELRIWVFGQSGFEQFFDDWVSSGYEKYKRPSCDRLNNSISYTLDNLRLVTWRDNEWQGHEDRRNSINSPQSISVAQISLDGRVINIFPSYGYASRETKVDNGNISYCCRGIRKTAGGFRWKNV